MIFKQIDSSVDKTRKTLALFNKDWYTYKTNWQNANGISSKIGSIFSSSNVNKSVISNEQVQILRNWDNAVVHGCTNQETFNRIIANADDNTKMYFAGLNKGKGSIEGLKNAQNVATQSTIGLTIAQTALNMAISLGLTALISLIVKGYDELANSVENCKERVADLISSHKSALETANNNANRVEELADKYEKLSKGVNNLGENVSLTNEEYEEYNSLANEIAEMFPTLVQGWTDEGTAVLNLKGNIEQLRDAYKEAQQEAYNLLITSGKDSDGNDIIKQWEDTHDTGFWAGLLDLGADDVGGGIAVSDALKQLKAIQNMTAEEYREIERITGVGSRKEIAGLSDIEKDIGYGSYLYKALGLDSNVTDEAFREAQRQARVLIQTYNAEIESALSDVETLANAYLMTNEDYDKLDEQSKTAASMLVNSLNADIANTFSSKEDVGVYVDKIVQSILSNSKAKDSLKDLFTMDTSDMSVDEIKKQTDSYINTIAEVLKEDPIELKARLGFDDSDIQPLINNVKEKLQDDFDDKVGELTLDELKIAADLEVSEEDLLSWDELIAKIKEVQSSTSNKTDNLSFIEAWEALGNTEDDTLKSTKDDLLALAEAGQLTEDSFNNTTGADTFLDQIGLSASEAIIKINELANSSTQLSSMGKQISAISEALATKSSDGFVDADTLSGFDASVRGIDTWKEFEETLGDSKSSMEECQNAANALATEYVNSNNFLSKLTDENKDYYITQLDKMGVDNAAEIVTNSLKNQEEALAQAEIFVAQKKRENANESYNLSNATASEIQKFAEETNMASSTATSLLQLALKKQYANNTTLDFSGDIANIRDLVAAIGSANTALSTLAAMKAANGTGGMPSSVLNKIKNNAKNEVNNALNKNTTEVKVNAGGGSSNSKGGSSSKSDSKTTIDWIQRKLERLQKIIDATKAKLENLFTVKAKTSNLDDQIKQTTNLLNAEEKAAKKYKSYADKYAKSSGLSKSLIKKIQSGDYSISDYSSKTADKINKYKELYDNYKEAQQQIDELTTTIRQLKEEKYQVYIDDAEANIDKLNALVNISTNYKNSNSYLEQQKSYLKTSYEYQIRIAELTKDETKKAQLQAEYQKELRDLEKQKFDNIQKYYENQIELIEASENAIQNQADLLEAKGMTIDAKYYTDQITYEKQKQAQLQKSRSELEAQLKLIVSGTDDWYECKSALADVNSELVECNKTIAEMNSNVTELADNFHEKMMNVGNTIMSTMDWAVSLMDNVDTFNSETGVMTKEGMATLGSYVSGYNTSSAMSESYRKLVASLESNYNKGTLSFTDSNGMKRSYNSLEEFKSAIDGVYEEWRDQISTTYDYENKIIDIMKEKLENELSALKDSIEAKQKALNAEKDLQSYKKSVHESTQNITSLEKQIAALQGDTSEETVMRIQKLQKDLADSQEDLQEKEYEQYISDQQDMLDKLYDEYSDLVTAEIQDVKHLLEQGIAIAQSMSDNIEKTIYDYVAPYDYNGRFNNLDVAISNITNDSDTSIASQIKKIANEGVKILDSSSGKNTSNTSNNTSNATSNTSAKSEQIQTSPNLPPVVLTIGDDGKVTKTGGTDDEFLKKLNNALNLKLPTKAVSMKVKGFKNGGIGKMVKPQGEDGLAWVQNGEAFIAPADVPHIQELIENVPAVNDIMQPLINLPKTSETYPLTSNIKATYNFTLENCTNADDIVKQIQQSQKVQKALREVTVNRSLGGSRLGVNKIK